ncbi:MAG: M14 family zinc carboxypeptidase, partial [Chloroflexota bacterium]
MKNLLPFNRAAIFFFMALATIALNGQDRPSGETTDNKNLKALKGIPAPQEHFGFIPGSDRNLFNYEDLFSYLQKVSSSSPMVKVVEIGKSPMGKKMFMALVSSEKNIRDIEKLRAINRELALNPDLSETKQNEYVKNGKVFFLATLSMHSTEVAPSQAIPLIVHKLVTTTDQNLKKYLDDVVYMIVPQNPDGMDMVVENYKKYKGTKYEGASMPGVYHKYVGHDNNRDYVSLTQEDTRAVARIYNLDWFPQVMIDKHQMGSGSIRYYVPPACDPIAENVDAELLSWTSIFGTNMLRDLTGAGLAGVGQKTIFDDYWPGSTQTSNWKGVISMLTEAASVRDATPIYVEPNELTVSGKGLSEYEKSINFPMPWKGGWWRLGDIVKLEIESTLSAIKTSSLFREDILKFRNQLCRKEVASGKTEAPYYYIISKDQADQSELFDVVNLLMEQGINAFTLTGDHIIDGYNFTTGDIVFPMAQPFRSFLKEVMEKQVYPVRHTSPNGEVIRPYDITSWSLPMHRGLKYKEISVRDVAFEKKLAPVNGRFGIPEKKYSFPLIFPGTSNGSYKAAFIALHAGATVERVTSKTMMDGKSIDKGSFLITSPYDTLANYLVSEAQTEPAVITQKEKPEVTEVQKRKVAIIETYFHDMDGGWTRYIFDTYRIPFTVVHPQELEKTDLSKFDVIVLPATGKQLLMTGKPGTETRPSMSNYPPEFQKGMGKKGLEKLLMFVNDGGTVVSWCGSTDLFTGMLEFTRDSVKEEFMLPFTNDYTAASTAGLFVPGSLMKAEFANHPLA